jgi:hypothetical protein
MESHKDELCMGSYGTLRVSEIDSGSVVIIARALLAIEGTFW